MNTKPALSFLEKEKICEYNFISNGPYWHLCTDGNNVPVLFIDTEDMKFVMNLIGICSRMISGIEVLTFEVMNNHIHIILSGEKDKCFELFAMLKSRIRRFFIRNGRCVDLSGFDCQLIPVTDLNMLRNEIIYTNRNGFLVHPEHTPFSYPWGAGAYFFNPMASLIPVIPFDSLPVKTKRMICRSHDLDFDSKGLMVTDNTIMPFSFCNIKLSEGMFRDAHNYFHLISKNFEAFNEISKRLHESVFLTDEELYSAISMLCRKAYGIKQPSLLPAKDKIEIAKRMHYEYNATNRQIRSILKLETHIIDNLFPATGK